MDIMQPCIRGKGVSACSSAGVLYLIYIMHHHHQTTQSSHSINAIGPAPHQGGRKREHRSIVFATITHIPSLHNTIRRNAPEYHTGTPLATPNIIKNKTQQLGWTSCIHILHAHHENLHNPPVT
jgi:hypothetical protein